MGGKTTNFMNEEKPEFEGKKACYTCERVKLLDIKYESYLTIFETYIYYTLF